MRPEDAHECVLRNIRHIARRAIASGESPMFLLIGYAGPSYEIRLSIVLEEMRAAVQRTAEDFAFYRKMEARP